VLLAGALLWWDSTPVLMFLCVVALVRTIPKAFEEFSQSRVPRCKIYKPVHVFLATCSVIACGIAFVQSSHLIGCVLGLVEEGKAKAQCLDTSSLIFHSALSTIVPFVGMCLLRRIINLVWEMINGEFESSA